MTRNTVKHAKPATHERLSEDEVVQGSSDRSFGLVFAAVFAVIGLWPLFSGNGVRLWSLAIAFMFATLVIARASALAPLNRLCTRFGLMLNLIISPRVIDLLFYVIIKLFALIMRPGARTHCVFGSIRKPRAIGSNGSDRDLRLSRSRTSFEGRNGISTRVLGVYEGAKEVLAPTNLRHDVSLRRPRGPHSGERRGTVHLHSVLIKARSCSRALASSRKGEVCLVWLRTERGEPEAKWPAVWYRSRHGLASLLGRAWHQPGVRCMGCR